MVLLRSGSALLTWLPLAVALLGVALALHSLRLPDEAGRARRAALRRGLLGFALVGFVLGGALAFWPLEASGPSPSQVKAGLLLALLWAALTAFATLAVAACSRVAAQRSRAGGAV